MTFPCGTCRASLHRAWNAGHHPDEGLQGPPPHRLRNIPLSSGHNHAGNTKMDPLSRVLSNPTLLQGYPQMFALISQHTVLWLHISLDFIVIYCYLWASNRTLFQHYRNHIDPSRSKRGWAAVVCMYSTVCMSTRERGMGGGIDLLGARLRGVPWRFFLSTKGDNSWWGHVAYGRYMADQVQDEASPAGCRGTEIHPASR